VRRALRKKPVGDPAGDCLRDGLWQGSPRVEGLGLPLGAVEEVMWESLTPWETTSPPGLDALKTGPGF